MEQQITVYDGQPDVNLNMLWLPSSVFFGELVETPSYTKMTGVGWI